MKALILAIAIVAITLTAVVFGIFNRRWAAACAFFVLHIALGGLIVGCMTYWSSEHHRMASQSRLPHTDGIKHASVIAVPKEIRG